MASSKQLEYRFLMVGRSGSGKSSLGNLIMGEKVFVAGAGLSSGTKNCECRRSKKAKNGLMFSIVDTPGFFDPLKSNKEVAEDIIKATTYLSPGPHAILYVVKFDRYTPEERDTFSRLRELFDDEDVLKYVIIVLTYGDELKKNKLKLEGVLENADEPFKEVLRKCGNRIVLFDNTAQRDKQVNSLLDVVRKILRENGEKPYSGSVQKVVDEQIQLTSALRLDEKIQNDPAFRQLFEFLKEKATTSKMDADAIEEKKEQDEQKKRDLERQMEDKERQEREAKEREEQLRKEREQQETEEKKREEEKAESERKRKEEEETKKAMASMQKELEKVQNEIKIKEKLEKEKRKLQEEYEKKLEDKRKEEQEKEARKLKDEVGAGKEPQGWVGNVVGGLTDAAGGIWRAASAWLGF